MQARPSRSKARLERFLAASNAKPARIKLNEVWRDMAALAACEGVGARGMAPVGNGGVG